ncbi:uncharacterized protein PF3D7_1120000-like [Onthophagus taurus]|uniref:uncharacterized protein PF3D7_1120000-like n=1 Tax=Onthophagus taurus TaxID=166361 RepID=UPI0039BDEF08
MAKSHVECGYLTLRSRGNDPLYPIFRGDVITIGSKDQNHIRIKAELDNKTDAVLTACKDTGYVVVTNPEKAPTILNEKPLTKAQYLVPGDILHIKNKFFAYNNDALTNKEIDKLTIKNAGRVRTAPKMRSSAILPVYAKEKPRTETPILSATTSTFQADYIAGITPSRSNSTHIVRQPKTVNSIMEKRKSKLSRRYSADIIIPEPIKKRASVTPLNLKDNNHLKSWKSPESSKTPSETPSKRKSLRNSVILRSAMQQQKHQNFQNVSPSTNTFNKMLSPDKSCDNEACSTPSTNKVIALTQSCSPRTLQMMQIASKSSTLQSNKKRRRTENLIIPKKINDVERRRSDFQEFLDEGNNKSFSNYKESTNQDNEILPNFYIRGKINRRKTNISLGQSTSTPIQVTCKKRAASESKVSTRYAQIEREENVNKENRNLLEELFDLSRDASNIESPQKSPRTIQQLSTERHLLVNAIFGNHNSTLSGSPIFSKSSKSINDENYTPQYEDVSMIDEEEEAPNKLEVSGIESMSEVPGESFLYNSSQSAVKETFRNSPIDFRLKQLFQRSPVNDLSNEEGENVRDEAKRVKKLFEKRTPKNNLDDVEGVKNLFKLRNSPKNDLTNIEGVKDIMRRRTVFNNLDEAKGVKKLFEKRTPNNNLDDVDGVKNLFKLRNSPINDLTNVEGVRDVLRRRTVFNNLDEVKGVKKLFEKNTPNNNLIDVEGVGDLFKRQNTPRNDLTDVRGVKRMLELHTPRNDLENVSLTNLYCDENMVETPKLKTTKINPNKSGIKDLFKQSDEEEEIVPKGKPSQDTFDALIGRSFYKTYKPNLKFESPDDSKSKVMNDSMTEAFESMKKKRKISKSLRTSMKEDGEKSILNTSADIFRVKTDCDSLFITPGVEKTSTPILKYEKRMKRNLIDEDNKDKENEESMVNDSKVINEIKINNPQEYGDLKFIEKIDDDFKDEIKNEFKTTKTQKNKELSTSKTIINKDEAPIRRTRRGLQMLKNETLKATKFDEDNKAMDENNKTIDKNYKEKASVRRTRRELQKLKDENIEEINKEKVLTRKARRDLEKLKDDTLKAIQIDENNIEKVSVRRTRRGLQKSTKDETYDELNTVENIDDTKPMKTPVKRARRGVQKLKDEINSDKTIDEVQTKKTPVKRRRKASLQKVETDKTCEEIKMDEVKSRKTPRRGRKVIKELKGEMEEETINMDENVDKNNVDDNVDEIKSKKTARRGRKVIKELKVEMEEETINMDENVDKKKVTRRGRKVTQELKDKMEETINIDENKIVKKSPVKKTSKGLQKPKDEIKIDDVNEIKTNKTPIKRTRAAKQKLKDETEQETNTKNETPIKKPRKGTKKLNSETQEISLNENVDVIKSEKAPIIKTRRGGQKLKDDTLEDDGLKTRSTRRNANKKNDENSNDVENKDSEEVAYNGSSECENMVKKRTRNVLKGDKNGVDDGNKVEENEKKESLPTLRSTRRNVRKVNV